VLLDAAKDVQVRERWRSGALKLAYPEWRRPQNNKYSSVPLANSTIVSYDLYLLALKNAPRRSRAAPLWSLTVR
jgi:hypothetical protein